MVLWLNFLANAGFDVKLKELQDILDIIASEEKAKADAKAAIEAQKTTPGHADDEPNEGVDLQASKISGKKTQKLPP